jgi:ADP-heptose:LPS heptosyltransferase
MLFNFAARKSSRIIRRADAARSFRKYREAALLYEEALRLIPGRAAIHIQCGHMFKEAGDLSRAEAHYLRAKELTPDDPDLALQFGHFHKVAGRLKEAELSYKRARELAPAWPEPAIQLANLFLTGWRNDAKAFENGLAPELSPQPPESRRCYYPEGTTIRSLGRLERTGWGVRNTVRGIASIRGFIISVKPIAELHATLDGVRFYSETPQEGLPLPNEKYEFEKRKYVFNIWWDFSDITAGLHTLQLQFIDKNGDPRVHAAQIVVRPPLSEAQYPNSDRLVSASASDPRSIEEQVNSLPSMIRPAKRKLFTKSPRKVLIIRVDQLGDMIISVPALRRIRGLLPEANLVGLLSLANSEFASTLNVFDEIIATSFPDDEEERRRIMPLEEQYRLRRRLQSFKFDVAIDLAETASSRPLLLLSGAPYLFGFPDGQSPWLSASFEGYARDPSNGMQEVSPAVRLLGLVEWFGTMVGDHSRVIRRDGLERGKLAPYGLAGADRFAVLHTGARLKFSQWPHYDKLASMILGQTDLKVVMMSDDPLARARLPPELAASGRFQLLDDRLPFDDFDALLSFCTVFIGNDSGPSHLASLRGANVINIYLNRHNWNEWGHENNGYVITRRVPCAGCNIHYDPEECGKGFACIVNISPDEVFRSVMEFV